MKKLCIFILALAATTSLFAERVQGGGLFYEVNTSAKTAVIVSETNGADNYAALAGQVITPPRALYYHQNTIIDVVGVASGAFANSPIEGITIPEGKITLLDNNAFANCKQLKHVVLSDNVLTIGKNIFENCTALQEVILSSKITSIPTAAFRNCTSLLSIEIGDNIKEIGEQAFYNCDALERVDIPASVTSIGLRAFASCNALTAINVAPGNPNYEGAFNLCDKQSTQIIQFPAGKSGSLVSHWGTNIQKIGPYAFEDCNELSGYTFGVSANIKEIGEYAFKGCTGLKRLGLVKCTTPPTLGTAVFSGINTSSIRLYVPEESITAYSNADQWKDFIITIDNPTKAQIGSLYYNLDPNDNTAEVTQEKTATSNYSTIPTAVTIPATVTYGTVSYKVIGIEKNAFHDCTGLQDVVIGDNVETIGDNAFVNCTNMRSIIIGKKVKNFGYYPFANCNALKTVYWNSIKVEDFGSEEASPFYVLRENITNILWGEEVEHIPAYLCYGMNMTVTDLPASVKSIGAGAFAGCSKLASIGNNFRDNGTSIGNGAFYGCAFYSFSFPSNPKFTSISAQVLANNTSLKYMTIPEGVTDINQCAFSNCSNLSMVTIPNSMKNIDYEAFRGCTGLTRVDITDLTAWLNITFWTGDANPLYYAHSLYVNGTKLEELVVPEGVTEIRLLTFYRGFDLTKVTIPEGVTSIGLSAFGFCLNLTEASIGPDVKYIDSYAFYGCEKLAQITNYAVEPQSIWPNVFGGDDEYPGVDKSTCKLYVPKESVEAYKAAAVWKDFANILPIEGEEGIENIATPTDKARKVMMDGTLYIATPDGKIYNAAGAEVK